MSSNALTLASGEFAIGELSRSCITGHKRIILNLELRIKNYELWNGNQFLFTHNSYFVIHPVRNVDK